MQKRFGLSADANLLAGMFAPRDDGTDAVPTNPKLNISHLEVGATSPRKDPKMDCQNY